MKILNYLSQNDWFEADDTELFCSFTGPATQVAEELRQDLGREIGYGYGCGGPPYETRIVLYIGRNCEFEIDPLVKLVEKFNYYFYFTHCYVLNREEMSDNTIEVTVVGHPIKEHAQLLAAANAGSYNAVMALGCSSAFPFDFYNPYLSGCEYTLSRHMAKLLLYAPVSISPLRALARACRAGLMVDRDERLASIFEHSAEIAEDRLADDELQELAESFNACDYPQFIFFSEAADDRQYVYDWLKRMADDAECPLHKTAAGMLEEYSENGLLDAVGIQRPKPEPAPSVDFPYSTDSPF